MTNWPAFIILIGGFVCIPLYYQIKSFLSLKALLLFVISFGLIAIRIVYIPTTHNSIFGNNFWIAGLSALLLLFIILFLIKLIHKTKSGFYTQKYTLILFSLYLIFGFFQQIMFQLVIFYTTYYLTNNLLLTITFSALFFSLYHLRLGEKYFTETLLLGFLFASFYAIYNNIFWLSIVHAVVATTYFTKVLDIKALETRLEIKMK